MLLQLVGFAQGSQEILDVNLKLLVNEVLLNWLRLWNLSLPLGHIGNLTLVVIRSLEHIYDIFYNVTINIFVI
jgi:hypothetical protein